jgi:hypothetical protein
MSTLYRLVIKSGPNAGQTIFIEGTEVIIGRETTNEIVISDPEVSRKHVRLQLQGANFVIEDLGSTNGTSVNGQRLVGPYILRPGEMITLGEHTHILFEAVTVDPDATIASVKPTPQPYAPQPFSQEAESVYQAPAYSAESYSGQVPAQPEEPVGRRRRLSAWVIALIVIVVVLLCGCIAFAIFDALNLYCEFPDIMNLLLPGACPP